MRGYLTDKADVYSFGVVTLEIVSGRSNTSHRPNEEPFNLLDWVSLIFYSFPFIAFYCSCLIFILALYVFGKTQIRGCFIYTWVYRCLRLFWFLPNMFKILDLKPYYEILVWFKPFRLYSLLRLKLKKQGWWHFLFRGLNEPPDFNQYIYIYIYIISLFYA